MRWIKTEGLLRGTVKAYFNALEPVQCCPSYQERCARRVTEEAVKAGIVAKWSSFVSKSVVLTLRRVSLMLRASRPSSLKQKGRDCSASRIPLFAFPFQCLLGLFHSQR